MAVCPFADQSKRYDRSYPGSYVAGFPYRLVPHSTETTGLPSYSGGAVAPHFTVDPRTGRIWQHYDTSRPSRALEHRPGTIDTNNARAIQVEIVAYSDLTACRKVGGLYVGSLTAAQQAPVRKLFAWILATHGITARAVPTKPYPASYGDNNGVRLSDSAWRTFRGVAEHQNVPHNNHGDAGALALGPLLTQPKPAPKPVPKPSGDVEMYAGKVNHEAEEWLCTAWGRSWLQNTTDRDLLVHAGVVSGSPVVFADRAQLERIAGPILPGSPVPPSYQPTTGA